MNELLNQYPDILSIAEVAEILHVTPATIRRHIKKNDIPYIKVGRLVRIPKDSFVAYLHTNKTDL